MTTTPDTLPRSDVLAAVRAAWDEATQEKHGNPIIALTTVLRALGMEGHVNEAPRTPEVVLRAMLRAYEQAALDAAIQRARIGSGGRVRFPVAEFEDGAMVLRQALAVVLAGNGGAEEYFRLRRDIDLLADYEARLAGTRPLDAPPMETP